MTLAELKIAIDLLVEDGRGEEPLCLEKDGDCFTVDAITVVIQSDLWVPETVILTCTPIITDGEADDG